MCIRDRGISAQQQLMVQHDDAGWRLAQDAETSVQPRSDEKAILSHVRVLEGAPPLSEYWTLFDTNDEVFNAGRTAQAATILFSITQNTQIEQLGRYIPVSYTHLQVSFFQPTATLAPLSV